MSVIVLSIRLYLNTPGDYVCILSIHISISLYRPKKFEKQMKKEITNFKV